jgi:hypothetical protein
MSAPTGPERQHFPLSGGRCDIHLQPVHLRTSNRRRSADIGEMKARIYASLVVAGVLAACASPSAPPRPDSEFSSDAQSGSWAWRYRVYETETGEEWPAGRAELSGRPGSYRFRLALQSPAPCAASSLPARVTVDDASIVITVSERMKGCGVRRFTIRKDGGGGTVERLVELKGRPATWELEEKERGLTAR